MTAEPLPAPPLEETAESHEPRGGRTLLSLVPSPMRARRAPFVALLISLLAGGLIGLLLLNTASAQDSFRLHDLQSQASDLQKQLELYSAADDGLDDPAVLYLRAAALGMVPGSFPRFLAPGQPIPAGARVLGQLAYIPAPKPQPTVAASSAPTALPTAPPTRAPTAKSSKQATKQPSKQASKQPVAKASKQPTATTSNAPAANATKPPAARPSAQTSAKAGSTPVNAAPGNKASAPPQARSAPTAPTAGTR